MFIQYMVLGFELTSSGTRVSSHNHNTRAPAPLVTFVDQWFEMKDEEYFVKNLPGGANKGLVFCRIDTSCTLALKVPSGF